MTNEMRGPLRWNEGATSPGRRALIKGAAVLLALGCGMVLLEVGLRLFAPQPILPRYVETGPYGIRKNIAAVHGEMIVPEYRHGFTTNSAGFRGEREYAVAKAAGTYRIIVLGDSVVLGHGVGDEETFAAILERDLSSTRPTEVLNMGVSGFGTAEELVQLRHVGLAYDPDLVILGYFPNDPYNNVVSRLFKIVDGKLVPDQSGFAPALYIRDHLYSIPGWSFLCQHSHLVNLLRNRVSGYFIYRLADQNQVAVQTSPVLTPRESDLTAALVNELNDELEQRRIPLVILNIPLVEDGKVVQNLPTERLRRLPNSPYVVDVSSAVYRDVPLEALFYTNDAHPTRRGHELIAKWLGRFITEKIWLKDGMQDQRQGV